MRKLEIDTDLQYSVGDSFGFDNNFNILRYSGHRECSISLYIDYGNLSSDYDVEQDCIIEDTRENRVKIQRAMTKEGWQRVSQVFGTLEELREDIGGVNYENIEELESQLDELGITHTSNYLRMSTSGYSQGDYAEVLINTKEFKDVIGVEFEEDTYQKWFDHYFWDSEICGEIGISFEYTGKGGVNVEFADTFDFREFTTDEYDMDGLEVDNILAVVKKSPHPIPSTDIAHLTEELNKLSYQDVTYPRCGC